jgi:hypothetical protein
MRRLLLLAAVLAALSAGVALGSARRPPLHGVVVEGRAFGGLPLGLTEAQVRARWGRSYGVCDNCRAQTWYYTYSKFHPRAIGVQFRDGRVEAYFTVGAPPWRTKRGLAVTQSSDHVGKLYGDVPTVECTGYTVKEVVSRKALLVVYLDGIEVYGLGLATRSASLCR